MATFCILLFLINEIHVEYEIKFVFSMQCEVIYYLFFTDKEENETI